MSIEKIIRERINQRPDISEQFEKAASLPVGTIRKRPNGNFIKTAQGWRYHSSASTSPSTKNDSQETSEKKSPKDVAEEKSSSRKKYGQEGYVPENTEQLIRDVRKNYKKQPLNVQREKIKEAMKKYFPNKATTKKENA